MKAIQKVSAAAGLLGAALMILPVRAVAQHYNQTNLVSDLASFSPANVDANLQNAWGLAHGPGGPWWISDNNDGKSTLYTGTGALDNVLAGNNFIDVPNAPSNAGTSGSPTGIIFNGSPTDFLMAPGAQAIFIFVTEDGTLSAWNPGINLTSAKIIVDNSQFPVKTDGAVYKGATIDEIGGRKFILAANFRSGNVDVFNTNFKQINLPVGSFEDLDLPPGFAPFNIQAVGPNVVITYAKQNAARHDDTPGAGLGFVDIYSNTGQLEVRLQHGSWFNAPWGVALAPEEFGAFTHALLIGNFGSGEIAAFNPVTGKFLGSVLDSTGSIVQIDGLWGLSFGDGLTAGPANSLYFTAGPNNEMDGLFGTLTPVASELGGDDTE